MTAFKRGDVVLVAFPFTDLTTTKTRPALVTSSDSFHRSGLDVILAGITSKIPKEIPVTDFLLSHEDQICAGLPKPSLVRLGKIVTLDCRLVRKKLGHIQDPTLDG
jgi:mRNA interferase MazF